MRHPYLIIFSIIVLVACSEKNINQELLLYSQQNNVDNQDQIFNIPMPTETQLNEFSTQYNVLNYKNARQFAYTEFASNLDIFFPEYLNEFSLCLENGNELPITLTNRPAIVFDYNEKPYYYEFGILYHNSLIGTLVILASPIEEKVIIDRVYTEPLAYDSYSFIYNRYVGQYPNVFYGNTSSTMYQKVITNNGQIELVSISDNGTFSYDEFLESIPQDDLDSMNTDFKESYGITFNQYIDIQKDSLEISAFWWEDISNPIEFYLGFPTNISNNFDVSESQKDIISEALNDNEYTDKYFVPEYFENKLLNTLWKGACGPSIMSWLYRGKFDKYRAFYIPLFGEYHPKLIDIPYYYYGDYVIDITYSYSRSNSRNKIRELSFYLDNGLYYQWFKRTDSLPDGDAMYHLGMSRGLREATDELYDVKFIIRDQAITLMKQQQEPIVIVCSTKAGPHYVGAIGLGYIKKKNGKKGHSYFYIVDNNYILSNNDSKPCWKKTNDFNLHYIWEKQF